MIALVCPTYDVERMKRYTEVTLHSFFATTEDGIAIVVDDGSKDWTAAYEQELIAIAGSYGKPIHLIHFEKNGGLTRSWNYGLAKAEQLKAAYAIAGNNDIIFTPDWYQGLIEATAKGYSLIGPVSNAPGITAQGSQEVQRYIPNYRLSDNPEVLKQQSAYLRNKYKSVVKPTVINGFFQFARMECWIKGKYSKDYFYRPSNPFRKNGKRNPTPLMTMNEDELQDRWHKLGMKSCIALDSFIFHYRSVTRGTKYLKGLWYRNAKN